MHKGIALLALLLVVRAAFSQGITFKAQSQPTDAPIQMIPASVVVGHAGPDTVKDIVYSNTNRVQVIGTIKDASGNSFNSVSNAGNYTYFTGDGRGYDFQIPAPAAYKYFISYAPGSLANQWTTNELARAAGTGVDYTNYTRMINGVVPWTPQPTNLLTANLNPNFWLKNIWGIQSESVGWGYNGTSPGGIGMTTNFISYFSAFALSPNAVLGTMDSGLPTNCMICFVDWNSNLVTRLVIAETNVTGQNAILYLLNSDLPPSIPPVYFMPTNVLSKAPVWTNVLAFGAKNIDLVYHSQYDAFLAGGLQSFYAGNVQTLSASHVYLNTMTGSTSWSVGYWITNNTIPTWPGDSGGVIGMVVGTNFVALSAFHYSNGGPNFCGVDVTTGLSAFDTIQNAMQALEQSAGSTVYPLRRIDLSQFKSY